MPCTMRPVLLLFVSCAHCLQFINTLLLCAVQSDGWQWIVYLQRLAVLMQEPSSWSSVLYSGSNSSFYLKQHTPNQSVWAHTLKVANLTSYKKLSVRYCELKLHMHTLGTSEIYFTYCKKEHNRSPLRFNCNIVNVAVLYTGYISG